MREILPGVLVWSRLSERHGYDFNGALVLHPEGNLCIDPVEPDAATLDRLAEEGVARILITQPQPRARRERGARAHGRAGRDPPSRRGLRARAGRAARRELAAGERVGPVRVVGVPGKSPGEVALHDPARRLLVVGDAVVGNPPGRLSLLRSSVIDDPAALRASLRRAPRLDFDALVVGDGVPILAGARDRLRELVAGFPD